MVARAAAGHHGAGLTHCNWPFPKDPNTRHFWSGRHSCVRGRRVLLRCRDQRYDRGQYSGYRKRGTAICRAPGLAFPARTHGRNDMDSQWSYCSRASPSSSRGACEAPSFSAICLRWHTPAAWQRTMSPCGAAQTTISFPSCAVVDCCPAYWLGLWQRPRRSPQSDFWFLLALGVVVVPASTILLSLGTRYMPAPHVTLIMMIEMMLAPLWVWFAFSEIPAHATVLGGILILVTVASHSLIAAPRQPMN